MREVIDRLLGYAPAPAPASPWQHNTAPAAEHDETRRRRHRRGPTCRKRLCCEFHWPYINMCPRPDQVCRSPRSLYRRSLKLSLDWAVHRHLWRGQALYIRSLFEANRDVSNVRKQRVSSNFPLPAYPICRSRVATDNHIPRDQALLKETEKLLETWKHPDPYCHPTAPGGTLWRQMERTPSSVELGVFTSRIFPG